MFDDLAGYFFENVIATFKEYKDQRSLPSSGTNRDVRLAIAAATAIYHFREHVPTSFQKSRADISKTCPDYNLLGDIVNAAKHRKITRGNPKIVSAEEIYEELVSTEYVDDKGPYRHVEKVVTVKFLDGTTLDLFEILINVLNMWFDELEKLGVSPVPEHIPPITHSIPQRCSESEAGKHNLVIQQGVRFHQRLRLQRYNYETGKIEPIDLTGCDVKARIYKPAYSIDLQINNDKTGEKLIKSVELTEKESLKLHMLETEEQRQAFMAKLIKNKRLYEKMFEEAGYVVERKTPVKKGNT